LAVIPEKGRDFFACEKSLLSIDVISPAIAGSASDRQLHNRIENAAHYRGEIAPQICTRFAGTAV
jgi:hypothetical protein